jgi:proteic killer suppression protein
LSLYIDRGEIVIRSFRHKGLKRFYEDGAVKGLPADHIEKIGRILARLDVATTPEQLDLPGWRLHPLRGDWNGFWSVTVNGNWRIVFRVESGDAVHVDYVDYH